jgi:hypothetical protein
MVRSTVVLMVTSTVIVSSAAAHAVMNKTLTTDDECFINVEWSWNPDYILPFIPPVPPPPAADYSGVHLSANWDVSVLIQTTIDGDKVFVEANHLSKCHPEDVAPANDGFFVNLNLPAAPAFVRKTISVQHAAGAMTHYDNITFEFTRRANPANNRLLVFGYHGNKAFFTVPALGWSGLSLFALTLVVGGAFLVRRLRREETRGASA